MDRIERFVLLAAFVALAIYRLIRYLRAGTAKRTPSAIPASGGIIAPTMESVSTVAAPDGPTAAPGSAASGLLGGLVKVLVWTAGNVVLWVVLLGWPALADVPAIWRLVAGIFANFYLIQLARAAGERAKQRQAARTHGDGPLR